MEALGKLLLLLAALCRIGGSSAAAQDLLEHGGIKPTTVSEKFGADCTALSADDRVLHNTVIGRQCYFSTTNTSLSWHSAWHQCTDIWPGAKLAWFDQPHGNKVNALRAAGFTGASRIALLQPYGGEAEHFVYEPQLPDTGPAYTPLAELCTASVTGKSSQYHDGSCYVYWDEGRQPPTSWSHAADKCTGHVPGYVGHLAWPFTTAMSDIITSIVGGKHSDRLYWLGARTVQPWSGTAGWHLWWNSTHREEMNGALPANTIPWGSGQPNDDPASNSGVGVVYTDNHQSTFRDITVDTSHNDWRHDGICEYRQPAVPPAVYEAVYRVPGHIDTGNMISQTTAGSLQHCAQICHEIGVDRCRSFHYSPVKNGCGIGTLPCSRSDAITYNGGATNVYSLQYIDTSAITAVLNVSSGATSRAKATAAHSAICVKDAPRGARGHLQTGQSAQCEQCSGGDCNADRLDLCTQSARWATVRLDVPQYARLCVVRTGHWGTKLHTVQQCRKCHNS